MADGIAPTPPPAPPNEGRSYQSGSQPLMECYFTTVNGPTPPLAYAYLTPPLPLTGSIPFPPRLGPFSPRR